MLLLFDIDGTLLTGAAREHAQALYEALHDVYGVRDGASARVEAAGRTDGEIARAVLLALGVSAQRIDERLDDLRAACVERYALLCPRSLADRVVPGVVGLLESLTRREHAILALVTGNLEPIARLKLERAGLGRYFARGQGGFGSDSEDRLDLPPIARRRAGLHPAAGTPAGEPYPRERTLVIGDTPRDIACAHADGLRCFAVTSGPYDAGALAAADAVAHDADELGRLLETELAVA